MSQGSIRFRAAAIFLIEGHLLVHEVANTHDGRRWFIPPGGGVLYGETSQAALIREIQEELGWDISEMESLGAFESFHMINGVEEHEISFLYLATAKDVFQSVNLSREIREADGTGKTFRWVRMEALDDPLALLYPPGLLDKLKLRDDRSRSHSHDFPS